MNNPEPEICTSCQRVIYLEQQMRVAQARLKVIIENVSCGVMMLDAQANILYANRYVIEALGYVLPEIIGRSAFDFTHPEETRLRRALFGKTLRAVQEQARGVGVVRGPRAQPNRRPERRRDHCIRQR